MGKSHIPCNREYDRQADKWLGQRKNAFEMTDANIKIIRSHPKLGTHLSLIYDVDPQMGYNNAIANHFRGRLNRRLQRKIKGLREYERIPQDDGRVLWKRLRDFSIPEFQTCIDWRSKFIRGNLTTLDLYRKLINDARNSQASLIGDVMGLE